MWGVIRRVFAVVGVVIAVSGFIAFLVAAVGVWWLKAEANRRTDELAAKAHKAVNAADHAVVFVREVVDQADQDLRVARTQPQTKPPTHVNPFVQISARQESNNLAGSLQRANAAIITASDAVEIAKTAVHLFGEDEELKEWLGVKPEQLVQTRTSLGMASQELQRVRTVLGLPIAEAGQPTNEQLMAMKAALDQARGFTNEMNEVVVTARTRVNETKTAVDMWVRRVAIGVTAIGVLGALGQFFMARFCWRVFRRKPV